MSICETACLQQCDPFQAQVDNGIPLPVCLRLFNEWVCKLEKEKGIHFLRPLSNDKFLLKEEQAEEKLVAMATWSGIMLCSIALEVSLSDDCFHFQCDPPT